MTSLSFLLASVMFFIGYVRTRNLFFLLLTIMFFLGFGEEISWGQRILHFRTPETIREMNVQNELTLHNLVMFNTRDHSGSSKQGLSRLLEINFLFKAFTLSFGILLPLLVFHSKFISGLTRKLRIPVPPVSIGIFFLVNWFVFRLLLDYLLPGGHVFQYYDTDTEIYEFVSAFIILTISVYFYFARGIALPGEDIKKVLILENVTNAEKG
jgi:hypothetical protein